jgi:hypothetical protein
MLDKTVAKVYTRISIHPKSMYMIARESGCANSTVGSVLLMLEREGKVTKEQIYNEQKHIVVEGWRKAQKAIANV